MATQHVSPAVDGAAGKSKSVPSWGILEAYAWMGKGENVTTAVSKTSDKKHIQITFYPRVPPELSRFYIHSPDRADMYMEPRIVATEDDLALLRVDTNASMYPVYYIYQADDDSSGTPPSLKLLPKTPYIHFHATDIGLLRLPGKQYIVAGFRCLPDSHPDGGLTLGVYDSRRGDWKLHSLSLTAQGRQVYGDNKTFVHKNCKVLTIGGDAGTMAFVDLWRGVLFCHVLELEREAAARQVEDQVIPFLGYVSLPDDLRRTSRIKADACVYRDIAFLDNNLKCVDLPSSSLWIRPATTSGAWSQQYMIRSFKEILYGKQHINLLPCHNTLYRSLNLRQPVLGLQDDDDARILYFAVKPYRTADNGSVLALDLSTKKILGVAPFVERESIKFDFTYIHTRLFKHFSGTKATLNQSGMVLQGSASKMEDKLFKHLTGGKVNLNKSGMVLQGSASKMKDKAQEQLDGESVAEDGDAMALD